VSGRSDAGAAFAEAVALVFEGDHGGVVDEPVDQGCGEMASPRISPHCPKPVAGDDDRAAFVAAGDQGEEEVGGLAFEREVADLVRRRGGGRAPAA
jgi:hypothetical protein